MSFTDVRLPFGKVLLLPSHLLGREVGIHSIFLSGRPIQLVNSYPSPGFLGVGVEVVAIVRQDLKSGHLEASSWSPSQGPVCPVGQGNLVHLWLNVGAVEEECDA